MDPAAKGEQLRVLQGAHDPVCPVALSAQWFERADRAGLRIDIEVLPVLGHGMVDRFWRWHAQTEQAVRRLVPEA